MDTSILHIILFTFLGIIAGIVNILAGGGSLLLIPVMIFTGISPAMAIGTIKIGLFIQCVSGSVTFAKKGLLDIKKYYIYLIPTGLGSIPGAIFAVNLPDIVLTYIISSVMILVVIFIIFKPQRYFLEHVRDVPFAVKMLLLFMIGLYGGFIQSGFGYVTIIVFSLMGFTDLVRINALKIFIGLIGVMFPLIVFALQGKVDWILGTVIAIGFSVGAYIGTHLSIRGGEKLIKYAVCITITVMAIKMIIS